MRPCKTSAFVKTALPANNSMKSLALTSGLAIKEVDELEVIAVSLAIANAGAVACSSSSASLPAQEGIGEGKVGLDEAGSNVALGKMPSCSGKQPGAMRLLFAGGKAATSSAEKPSSAESSKGHSLFLPFLPP